MNAALRSFRKVLKMPSPTIGHFVCSRVAGYHFSEYDWGFPRFRNLPRYIDQAFPEISQTFLELEVQIADWLSFPYSCLSIFLQPLMAALRPSLSV